MADKTKIVVSGLPALGLSILKVNAWNVSRVASCLNGATASGMVVSLRGVGSTTADNNGALVLELPQSGASYIICVDRSTGNLQAHTRAGAARGNRIHHQFPAEP